MKSVFKYFLCWLCLIQTLNLSVDPPDLRQYKSAITHREDLSVDETESLFELISEGLLDMEVPESDDNDIDANSPLYDACHHFTSTITISKPIQYLEHRDFYKASSFSTYDLPGYPPPENG